MEKLYKGDPEKLIAVCIAGIDEYAQSAYMDEICHFSEQYNYKILFFTSFSSICMADKYFAGEMNIYTLINFRVLDGLILFAETIKSDETIERIISSARNAKIPVVTIDHAIEGCYNIVFDYRSAMEKLVRHIVEEHEYQKVEFIGGMPGNPASEERLDIFRKVMQENRREIKPSQIHYGYFWSGPAEKVMDEICARDREQMPDAIICANDAMALVACRRLKEKGYRIPMDIAVTGFDGIREAMDHIPSLTTARLDSYAAVKRAYEILDAVFRGREVVHEHIVDFKIVYGESCGCAENAGRTMQSELIQRLYDKISANHFFSNRMVGMTADLSDSVSVSDAMEKIQEYLQILCSTKSFICIVDDYIRDAEDLQNRRKESGAENRKYTNQMKCLVAQDYMTFTMDQTFLAEEMLPDLKQNLIYSGKMLITPLHVLDRTIGYFAISYEPGQNDFHQLQSFASTLSNILEVLKYHVEQQKLIERLESQSSHDALTGILNRRGFFLNIDKIYDGCAERGSKIAVISVDMDGLKRINDTYGHNIGDEAIIFTARALEQVCGDDFCCSRIGGDEFMVAGAAGEDAVLRFEERLQELFDEHNRESGEKYRIGFSLGMVYDRVSRDLPMEEFIRMADARMYQQKEEHRKQNGYIR